MTRTTTRIAASRFEKQVRGWQPTDASDCLSPSSRAQRSHRGENLRSSLSMRSVGMHLGSKRVFRDAAVQVGFVLRGDAEVSSEV